MNVQTQRLLATWPFDDVEREFVTALVTYHGVELVVRDGRLYLRGLALKDDL
jgi:hypothetical protein